MSDIANNLNKVKDQLNDAAAKSGRKLSDIKLIAVTKTVEADIMNEAIDAGATDIGENRVQEVVRKYEAVRENVNWHLIGQLQTNKVKYIIDKVCLIHSLDRLSLAEELQKRCFKNNIVMPVLIQVNIGREESKSGILEEEIENFVHQVAVYKNISVKGLMTVAPAADDIEDVRPFFKKMYNWFNKIKDMNIPGINMEYLSMGMSHDFSVAVQEGANMVRIGTAIFGKRNYNK